MYDPFVLTLFLSREYQSVLSLLFHMISHENTQRGCLKKFDFQFLYIRRSFINFLEYFSNIFMLNKPFCHFVYHYFNRQLAVQHSLPGWMIRQKFIFFQVYYVQLLVNTTSLATTASYKITWDLGIKSIEIPIIQSKVCDITSLRSDCI